MEAVTSPQKSMNKESCKKHLDLQNTSGFSMKRYCRENNINYSQFLYWARKFSFKEAPATNNLNPLISVKLKNKNVPSRLATCTLIFKNGCLLKIDTLEALTHILERMS
jgi:hypothetical protein